MPPHHSQLPLYTADRPEVIDVVRGLRRVLDEFPARVLIGEIYLPIDRLMAYYGRALDGAHLPFNFQLLQGSWSARRIAGLIEAYEAALPRGGWPNWVLGNHDTPRIASRVGAVQARVAAMLLLTLRGTPTLYYGDELGMRNVPIPAHRVQDPFEKNVPGLGLGRDPCRTPMQWEDIRHAGFTVGEPWLPLADDYAVVNVRSETRDPDSILRLYRELLRLRRTRPSLIIGDYQPCAAQGDLLAYVRTAGEDRLLVALNFGGESSAMPLITPGAAGRVLLSTYLDRHGESLTIEVPLRPGEGVIVELG